MAIAGASVLTLALIPTTVAYAAIDPEDPGPASGPCLEGWGGTPGDCDPPNDIDVGGDGSDEGDGDENAPEGEAPGVDDEGVGLEPEVSDTGLTPDSCGDTGVLPEEEPLDQTMPLPEEEPVIDTPRQAPRQQSPGVMSQADWQAMMIRMLSRMPGWETESNTTAADYGQTGPANLEGLGIGG